MSVSVQLRVLVVDDDPSVRSYVEVDLQRHDYDVVAMESVDEARVALEQSRVELVVTDLRMPDASGRDLFEDLRSCLQSVLADRQGEPRPGEADRTERTAP